MSQMLVWFTVLTTCWAVTITTEIQLSLETEPVYTLNISFKGWEKMKKIDIILKEKPPWSRQVKYI